MALGGGMKWTICASSKVVNPAYHPGNGWDLFQVDRSQLKLGGIVSDGLGTYGVASDSEPIVGQWKAVQGGWSNSTTQCGARQVLLDRRKRFEYPPRARFWPSWLKS
jgi:hypothetical protein